MKLTIGESLLKKVGIIFCDNKKRRRNSRRFLLATAPCYYEIIAVLKLPEIFS